MLILLPLYLLYAYGHLMRSPSECCRFQNVGCSYVDLNRCCYSVVVRVVQPLNPVAVEFIPPAMHCIACWTNTASWVANVAVKFVPNTAIWGKVWTVESKLDGLSSWLTILVAFWMLVLIVFAKAGICCVATVIPQVNGAEAIAKMPLLILLLTHTV